MEHRFISTNFCRVNYSFSLDGKEYNGNEMYTVGNLCILMLDHGKKRIEFAEGNEIPVYYEPTNPAHAALKTGFTVPSFFNLFTIGFILMSWMTWGFFKLEIKNAQ